MTPIGIDPASGKKTCIWKNGKCSYEEPQYVRSIIKSLISDQESTIIAWDAPISFNGAFSHSDRKVDKAARAWARHWVEKRRFEKGAINALPFSGLSHWVISCEALGLPYGDQLAGLEFFKEMSYTDQKGAYIIEVHPAVAMGCLWLDKGIKSIFPVYKKSKEARRNIVGNLHFPEDCIEDDDALDAYVAHLMALDFITGKAAFVNDPSDGSYVLPSGKSYNDISDRIRLL